MTTSRSASLLLVAALAGACATTPTPPSAELELLAAWMTGSFSSAEQAAEDPAFFDIRLHMARIWTDREEAAWLYVEQAATGSLDRPYRQRVYRVSQLDDDLFESRVFELEEPLRFAGVWRQAEPLAALSPDDLVPRQGCSILLRFDGEVFEGSTLGRLCRSALRGASYATSEVRITADGLVSWDRGWDDSGTQVWGAETGGYVFQRSPAGVDASSGAD